MTSGKALLANIATIPTNIKAQYFETAKLNYQASNEF